MFGLGKDKDDEIDFGTLPDPAEMYNTTGVKESQSSNPVRRLIADPLVGLAKGAAVGIPETIVGLLDIPTMGHAGKVAETVSRGLGLGDFKSANEMFSNLLTPETRESQQKVAETKGFLPTISTAIQNPSSIVQTVAESLPAMVTGMRVAGAVSKLIGKPLVEAGVANLPRIATVGGIAEGAITAGQNTEQTRQQTEKGTLTPTQVGINILSGVLTGMIGVAGGRLAQRFRLEDIDTLFTGGRSGIVGDKEKGIFKKVLMGAFQEGVLEELPQSMQEQIAQNLALNKPIDDGVFEAGAMGMLAGFAQSTGANIAGSTMQKMKNELDPINQTIKKLVEETLPGELNAIGGWDNGKPAENLTPTAISETPHVFQPSEINYGEEIYIPPPAPTEPPPESFSTGLQGMARELNIGQPAQLTPEEVMVENKTSVAPENVPVLEPLAPAETSIIETPEVKGAEIVEPAANVEGIDLQEIKRVNPELFREAQKATSVDEFINKMSKGKPETVSRQVLSDFYNKVKPEALPAPLSQTDAATLGVTKPVAGESLNVEGKQPWKMRKTELDKTVAPLKDGYVRFYHGGTSLGNAADVTPDIRYAAGYAKNKNSGIEYIDVPENSPFLKKSFDDTGADIKSGFVSFRAPSEMMKNAIPVSEKVLENYSYLIKAQEGKVTPKPPITNQEQLKQRLAEGKRLAAEKRAEIASKPITPIPTAANTFAQFVREQGYNFPEEVEKKSGRPIDKFKELNKKLLKQNNTSYEQLMAVYKASKNIPAKEVSNEAQTQTVLGSKSNLKLSITMREVNDENKQDIETLKKEIEMDTGRKLGNESITEVLFVPENAKQQFTGNESGKQNERVHDLNAYRRETNQGEVQKIANVFGKKIVWVKINDPNIFFNGGISDKIPNKIFINVDSAYPHLMVLGHELIHTMKIESPKLYSQLKDYLSPEIQNMDKFEQALSNARDKAGLNKKLEDSIIYEELISEFSGEQFTNKDFWNKLSEKNPTLFERLSGIAKNIIDKIINVFNKNSNLISSSFFKDIQKSQKALTDAMNEYAKRTGKEIGNDGNVHFSISEYIPDSLSSWFKQTSTNSRPTDISQSNGTWETPTSSTMNTLNYVLADRNIDLRDVTKAIEKTHGILEDQKNASLKETLFSGRLSSRIDDFVNNELHAVTKAMAKNGVSLAQIEEYMHARHAEEANNYLDSLPEGKRKGDAGISTEDANDYLESLDPALKEKYENVALMLDKVTHKNAQLLVDYGLESQETIDKWFDKYKHYVPLFREDIEERPGTGQGFTVSGSASKGRTGSERKVVHILSNIAMQRERTLTRGEKNRVSQSLVSLAENFPNEDFWKVIKIPRLSTFIAPGVEAKIKPNVVVARVKDEKTGEIKHIGVQFNEKNERAARMATALKNMDMDTMGEILGNLGKITRYVSAINTQYNPVFGVTNFFRDMGTAVFNLSTTPIAGKQKAVLSNTLPAMKGIWQATRGDESSEMAKMFKDFQLHGGQTGYRNLFVVSEDRAKNIERELKSLQTGKPRRYLSAFAKILSDYNTMSENSIRLSAYKVGIESGMTKDQAASMAKNLTVNFNKKGQIAGQAGALYAFFNASVQGAVRMYETMKGPMGKKIIAGGIILGATQAMMLAAAGFKDEEPPEFVKERNIIIPIGGKKYITFPMPLGFNVIPNVGRILAEITLGGGKNAGVKMSNLIGVIMETFNPMGSSGLSMQTVAPTFLDPFAALAENKDWTGRPIYKEDFNALNPTPGTSRVKDSATVFGRGLAWAFNILTGGDKYTPGLFSPTADQIDYLGGQITGGLGREIGKTSMMFESLFTGNELPTYRLPLTGRFYGSAEGRANESVKYYSNLKKLNIHEANIKGRIKDREPIGKYIKDNPEAKLWRMANTIENTIGKIKKRKEFAKTPEAKKTYDKLITIQQKRLNDMVERLGN